MIKPAEMAKSRFFGLTADNKKPSPRPSLATRYGTGCGGCRGRHPLTAHLPLCPIRPHLASAYGLKLGINRCSADAELGKKDPLQPGKRNPGRMSTGID